MKIEDLYVVNPYENFDASVYPNDVHGWGSDEPIFGRLIGRLRPKLIIEVGTWKGASAIHMAYLLMLRNLKTSKIVCVDTWLGGVDFWEDKNDAERYPSLRIQNGYPQVFYQFLANVVNYGHTNRIIPFPQTSQIAARWFRRQGVAADLIYIDASHDYDDVLADIRAYWEILRPGGVLFGDDYYVFTDVNRAVEDFCKERGLSFSNDDRKWMIEKK